MRQQAEPSYIIHLQSLLLKIPVYRGRVFLWREKLLKCEYISSGIEQANTSLLAHHQLINSTRLIFPGNIEDLACNFYRMVYLSRAIISNSVLKFNRFADSFCKVFQNLI